MAFPVIGRFFTSDTDKSPPPSSAGERIDMAAAVRDWTQTQANYRDSGAARRNAIRHTQQIYSDSYAGLHSTPARYRLSAEEAMGHSLLNSVARYYSFNFPDAPLSVRRVDREPMKPRHEVLAEMALEEMGLRTLVGATRDAVFFGDGIVLAPREMGQTRPALMVWCPYHLVTFMPSNEPPYITYNIAGYDWPQNEILHYRNMPSMANENIGDGPIFHLLDVSYADRQVVRRISALMSGASANKLFTPAHPEASLSEKDIKAMEAKLSRASAQSDESTRVAFANRQLQKIELGEDAARARFPELGRVTAERINAEFRIPLSELGIESGVGRNALGEGSERINAQRAVRNFLVPAWNYFSRDMNEQLMPIYSDSGELEYYFDTTQVVALRESDNDLHERVRADWNDDLITRNQAMKLIGEQEYDDETGDMVKSEFLAHINAKSSQEPTEPMDPPPPPPNQNGRNGNGTGARRHAVHA